MAVLRAGGLGPGCFVRGLAMSCHTSIQPLPSSSSLFPLLSLNAVMYLILLLSPSQLSYLIWPGGTIANPVENDKAG